MSRYKISYEVNEMIIDCIITSNKFSAFNLIGTLTHFGQIKNAHVFDRKKNKTVLQVKDGVMQLIK